MSEISDTHYFANLYGNFILCGLSGLFDKFLTIDEIETKYEIGLFKTNPFGDTDEKILLLMFNDKIDDENLDLLDMSKPYDVLNLARYYKHIKKNDEKFIELATQSFELGCYYACEDILLDMFTKHKFREAIDFIEQNTQINKTLLPVGTIMILLTCADTLNDNILASSYMDIFLNKMNENCCLQNFCNLTWNNVRKSLKLQKLWQKI